MTLTSNDRLRSPIWTGQAGSNTRTPSVDVLPNPVAANLLISLGPKGPIRSYDLFAEIVTGGGR